MIKQFYSSQSEHSGAKKKKYRRRKYLCGAHKYYYYNENATEIRGVAKYWGYQHDITVDAYYQKVQKFLNLAADRIRRDSIATEAFVQNQI
jgi:hypothetical protein